MTVNEVTEFLQTSKRGLVEEEAVRRLGHYGPNALPQPPRFSYAKILWRQLSSSLVMLLLGAGTLSLVLGKTVDAVVIFLAVAINTIMGFVQELKAETARIIWRENLDIWWWRNTVRNVRAVDWVAGNAMRRV